MEPSVSQANYGDVVHVTRPQGHVDTIVVCEHASKRIPQFLNNLGASETTLNSHTAWDPGALGVSTALSHCMSAALVSGGVSRLVYDCNRPPESPSAMPSQSERHTVPGNANLNRSQRNERITCVYGPFEKALADEIASNRASLNLMVTIHSFTPLYHGVPREVEIGILHGIDDSFALSMMKNLPDDQKFVIRLNQPYAASDGVAHTLDLHGHKNTLPSVMIEIRNDLIETTDQQNKMADYLLEWIQSARQTRK